MKTSLLTSLLVAVCLSPFNARTDGVPEQVKATNLQSVHDLVGWVAQMARKCAAQPGTATFRFDVQGGAAAAAGLGKRSLHSRRPVRGGAGTL